MIKNILVTGGCGFIGSNITNYFAKKGYKLFVIDDLSIGNKSNLIDSKNIKFFRKNINSINRLKINHSLDACIHLAAKAEIMISKDKESQYFFDNVDGLQEVLNFCSKRKIKKFIFASSASVYGDTFNKKVKEDKKKNPLHFYGYTKSIGEEIVKTYCEINKLNYYNLRFFNVYGNKSNAVVAKFIAQYLQNKPITIYGSGNQSRDFINIDDVIKIIEILLKRNFQSNIFNVGSSTSTKIIDIKNLISKKSEFAKLPKRFDDIEKSISDNSKVKRALKWKPNIKLKSGIEKMIIEDKKRLIRLNLVSSSKQRKIIKKFNSQK